MACMGRNPCSLSLQKDCGILRTCKRSTLQAAKLRITGRQARSPKLRGSKKPEAVPRYWLYFLISHGVIVYYNQYLCFPNPPEYITSGDLNSRHTRMVSFLRLSCRSSRSERPAGSQRLPSCHPTLIPTYNLLANPADAELCMLSPACGI